MQDTEYKRLIQLSKERAIFAFVALMQRALQDGDREAGQKLPGTQSGYGQTAMTVVRNFMRHDANVFLRHVEVLYRKYLDRALQTMYVDFRPKMQKMRANELSLIDDEAVSHQIEVGRLTQRIRDASEESIGRLNVIISGLHGEQEARERENPFRPYLLARPVYEAINELAGDEQTARTLFDYISNMIVEYVEGYYAAVREVFEASGMEGKFITVPSRVVQGQRYFGAPPFDYRLAPAELNARILPGLQRMVKTLRQIPALTLPADLPDYSDSSEDEAAFVADHIQKILRRSGTDSNVRFGSAFAAEARPQASAGSIIGQLSEFQGIVARGEPMPADSADGKPERNHLFALRERLDFSGADMMERLTLEMVGMLFELILDDPQVPEELRAVLGDLQVPVLKAAIIDPGMLHDERHPVRALLNRLASAAAANTDGNDGNNSDGPAIAEEIRRVVRHVLDNYDRDASVFAEALSGFEDFMSRLLRRDDTQTAKAIEAVEAAERISILLGRTTSALCEALLSLNTDKRVSDFAIQVWPHVLARAAWQDAEQGRDFYDPAGCCRQYYAVLPELLWSVQEKADSQERAALMKLLPGLASRLASGLNLIQLPEEERKQILDQFVDMHMQALRPAQSASARNMRSLDDLRRDFARLAVHWERLSWELPEPPPARASILEETLSSKSVAAEMHAEAKPAAALPLERDALFSNYMHGTRVELHGEARSTRSAQLVWTSTYRSFYLFRTEKDSALVIYSYPSLLAAIREGVVVPVQNIPAFERAIESLLWGVENLRAGRG